MASIKSIQSKLESIEGELALLSVRQSVIQDDLSQLSVISDDVEPEDIPQTVSGTAQRRRELEAELEDISISRIALEARKVSVENALYAKQVESATRTYKKKLKDVYGLISKHNKHARDVCQSRVDISDAVRAASLSIADYRDEGLVRAAIQDGYVIPSLPRALRQYNMFTIPEKALVIVEPEIAAAEEVEQIEGRGDQRAIHNTES